MSKILESPGIKLDATQATSAVTQLVRAIRESNKVVEIGSLGSFMTKMLRKAPTADGVKAIVDGLEATTAMEERFHALSLSLESVPAEFVAIQRERSAS